MNYGVGCPGGVEVVAHSLRDCLNEHKDQNSRLISGMRSTRSSAHTLSRLPARCSQLCRVGRNGAMETPLCCSMIMKTSLNLVLVFIFFFFFHVNTKFN